MGAEQVRGLNERFLELMREAAFADNVLTAGELTELKRAADALAAPDYFDDLQTTITENNMPAIEETDSGNSAQGPEMRSLPHTWPLPLKVP